jgi:ribokinase
MPRVIVLGSSGHDLTIRLPRLPAVGETCLGGALERGPGGKGANAAVAARKAGAEVVLITAYGDDLFGRATREDNARAGLDLSHARVVASAPGQVALIFVDGEGRNQIGVAPGASARFLPGDIDRLPDDLFRRKDVLLACLELPLETVARGLERAHCAGVTTILNPAPADPSIQGAGLVKHVDVITPNQEELRALTGLPAGTIAEAQRASARLLERGWRTVIATLGDQGCLLSTRDEFHHLPALRVEAVDTVGAGDAFNGALAVALTEGFGLRDAARWANVAAALATTRPGAQSGLPGRPEIATHHERYIGKTAEFYRDDDTLG